MNSTKFLLEIQQQMNDVFKAQDPELLDVVFEVDGKKLYADKLRLSVVSSTFKSMLSIRWNFKNEPIKIKNYKHDDFKEFLAFIYCGNCNITKENIYDLLDMAEYYQIKHLKELCDEYLSKMEYDLENVFQLMETSIKYSLIQAKQPIQTFISQNFITFLKLPPFLSANELFMKEVIVMEFITKPEEVFQAVYEWADYQVISREKESKDNNFNMNDAIRDKITLFLPYFQLKKMEKNFLNSYVAKRSFLFTVDELSAVFELANSEVKVKITNSWGMSISGSLPYNYNVIEIIKSLKGRLSDNSGFNQAIWCTVSKTIPSRSSSLKKRDVVKWYLAFNSDKNIVVKSSSCTNDGDYLLAELNSDNSFFVTPQCKIDVE